MIGSLMEEIKKISSTPIVKILAGLLSVAILVLVAFLIVHIVTTPKFTGLSQKTVEQTKKEITKQVEMFPIAKVLPYGGPLYKKPFYIHPLAKDGTILVDIDKTKDENTVKEEVYNWVRYNGYKPDDYQFTFRATDFSTKK